MHSPIAATSASPSAAPGPRPRRLVAAATTLVLIAGAAACGGDSQVVGGSDGPTSTLAPAVDPDSGDELGFELVDLGLDLDEPIDLVAGVDDDELLIAERAGVVRSAVIDGDSVRLDDSPVLEIRELVGSTESELGMFGIALHPDGDRLYVSYTRAEDGASQVDEYELGRNGRADPSTRRNLVDVAQPETNHNGGQIRFGPDGALYLGLGDGGGGGDPEGNGQNPDTLLGTMLRIDVDAEDAEPEIHSIGLRNPWRFSFDRDTGDLWIADVGQGEREEINRARAPELGAGANYGWDLFEGDQVYQGSSYDLTQMPGPFTEPIFAYGHDVGCSVTGGVVARSPSLAAIDGWYLYSDLCSNEVRALPDAQGDGPFEGTRLVDGVWSIVGFGESADGEVYVISLTDGIHRLVAR